LELNTEERFVSKGRKIEQIDLANWEIFLWSLYQVGGDKGMVDVELAFIKAHQLAPGRFSWRTRDDLPEIKKLSKALRDAEAKAGSMLTKTSDGLKRQLTISGIQWVENNFEHLKKLGASDFSAGQARSRKSTKWLIDIQNSEIFEHWKEDGQIDVQKWQLAGLLQCSPDSPIETWDARIEQTAVAAHHANRDDVVRFLKEIKRGLFHNE
jgi:hypothetical protein